MDEFGGKIEVKETVKRKSRNLSEKKRRDQFNILINELHSIICPGGRKMDKTAILKAAISYLLDHNENQLRSNVYEITETWKPSFLCNNEFSQLMLEALDSFMMVVTKDGMILYVSDGITPILKYLPKELTDSSFFELVHPVERCRVKMLLNHNEITTGPGVLPEYERSENQLQFTCHVRVNPLSIDDTAYVYCECKGSLQTISGASYLATGASDVSSTPGLEDLGQDGKVLCYCCSVSTCPDQIPRELSLHDHAGNKQFSSRHNMEWKFLFLDNRGSNIIGYLPLEVLGTSGYDYCHPNDLAELMNYHALLIETGEGNSCYYRFLTKGQEALWIQSHYYITHHQWTSRPEFVVCTHTVVSYSDVLEKIKLDKENNFKNRPKPNMSPCCTSSVDKDENLVGSSLQDFQSSSFMASPRHPKIPNISQQFRAPSTSQRQCMLPPSRPMKIGPYSKVSAQNLCSPAQTAKTNSEYSQHRPNHEHSVEAAKIVPGISIDSNEVARTRSPSFGIKDVESASKFKASSSIPKLCPAFTQSSLEPPPSVNSTYIGEGTSARTDTGSPSVLQAATLESSGMTLDVNAGCSNILAEKEFPPVTLTAPYIDMLPKLFHMNPLQQQLKRQLEDRHTQLQQIIQKEGQELNRIWGLLMLTSQFMGDSTTEELPSSSSNLNTVFGDAQIHEADNAQATEAASTTSKTESTSQRATPSMPPAQPSCSQRYQHTADPSFAQTDEPELGPSKGTGSKPCLTDDITWPFPTSTDDTHSAVSGEALHFSFSPGLSLGEGPSKAGPSTSGAE